MALPQHERKPPYDKQEATETSTKLALSLHVFITSQQTSIKRTLATQLLMPNCQKVQHPKVPEKALSPYAIWLSAKNILLLQAEHSLL